MSVGMYSSSGSSCLAAGVGEGLFCFSLAVGVQDTEMPPGILVLPDELLEEVPRAEVVWLLMVEEVTASGANSGSSEG